MPESAIADEHTPSATVAKIAGEGGHCVKMYYEEALWAQGDAPDFSLPSIDIIRDVVSEAHTHNMPVLLHATTNRGYDVGLEGGIDVFVHGPWDWPGVEFDDPNIPEDISSLLNRIASSDAGLQPTMRTLKNTASMYDPTSLSDPALFDVLPEDYMEYMRTDAQKQRSIFFSMFGGTLSPDADETEIARLQSAFNQRYEKLTGQLDKLGARLLFGTDTSVGGFGWGNPPGLNGYWEMQGWARGGVSLQTIFEAATLRNAQAFGLDDEIGTVEAGTRADLLLLERNPLESVEAYGTITEIILRGRRIVRSDMSARNAD